MTGDVTRRVKSPIATFSHQNRPRRTSWTVLNMLTFQLYSRLSQILFVYFELEPAKSFNFTLNRVPTTGTPVQVNVVWLVGISKFG